MDRVETKSAAMKNLEDLLNRFDDHDPQDVERFQQLLGQTLDEAFPALSDRLVRPRTSWNLKRLILASPPHFPHPGWTKVLLRAMMHETDAQLFEEGCRALVQIGGTAETDALRQIAGQRQEPDFQAIVARKLIWLESRQPFSYHFRDLLLGSRNPHLSGQAALHLITIARLSHFDDLAPACNHPDPHVSNNAIRVIASLHHRETGQFLMKRFEEMASALMLDNWFRSAQEQIKRAASQSVIKVICDLLRSCPGAGPFNEDIEAIEAILENPEEDALPLVQRLKGTIQGVKETRLVDCLADLALGHSVRINHLIPETPEEFRQRTQWLQNNLDACAEGIAMLTRRGVLEKEDVLPLFQRAYENAVGGDGFGKSFVEILDDEDQAQLNLILAATNHHWREDGIRILGERRSSALVPFFLRATGDPIVDNAHLAIRYLGMLPGAFDVALEYFHSGKPDRIELALTIFSLNDMAQAGPALVDFVGTTEREDLLMGVIQCLGVLRFESAIPVLLELLRGGQSLRLLRVIAETLVAYESLVAAKGLLQKAQEIRNSDIQLAAIEGITNIRRDFLQGLSEDEGFLTERLLDACFEEGGGVRNRALAMLAKLWTLDDAFYERLGNHIGKWIGEQKKRPTWDRDQHQVIAGAVRELERKRRELSELTSSGRQLRQLLMSYAPGYGTNARSLKSLSEALGKPGIFIGSDLRVELEALIISELGRAGIDEIALERLCELCAQVHVTDAVPSLKELMIRSSPRSLLRMACSKALQSLGVSEEEPRDPPASRTIILLDPSGFFRKRLVSVLESHRVQEAQDRAEAEALIGPGEVDVLISESSDSAGDLQDWIAKLWRARRVRQVILSTTLRVSPDRPEKPWLAGVLFKPYPMEDLLALLRS